MSGIKRHRRLDRDPISRSQHVTLLRDAATRSSPGKSSNRRLDSPQRVMAKHRTMTLLALCWLAAGPSMRLGSAPEGGNEQMAYDLLIKGGTVVDGTGAPDAGPMSLSGRPDRRDRQHRRRRGKDDRRRRPHRRPRLHRPAHALRRADLLGPGDQPIESGTASPRS